MVPATRKIINDPVHGFITLDTPLIRKLVAHPFYQRLRRIHQMAFAHLVYPGAVHTRLHHSLGAYHLMYCALNELKSKGVDITPEEETAAKAAILLHDIGHGPFSHALEQVIIRDVHHESISLMIMQHLNEAFGGELDLAIRIFTDQYEKPFLHQLVSGQLDVDRLDYLTRDSFFTGVSEGVVGYDRIIKMLTVHNGQLMVEEKAIYSIEKFLVSRRLMYWQVYLHKTVLGAEKMLIRILERAMELMQNGDNLRAPTPALQFFLENNGQKDLLKTNLLHFCLLDDTDILAAVKTWMFHPDKILSQLCRFLTERNLYKVKLQAKPFDESFVQPLRHTICQNWGITENELKYYFFSGETESTMYQPGEEGINILFKDGSVKGISEVDNALIHHHLSAPVKKFYICYKG